MSQYLLSRAGSCSLVRQTQGIVSVALRSQSRSFASARPIPEAKTDGMSTQDFLTSIGRNAVSKVKVTDWNEFWSLDGHAMKEAGLAVRDRRYILWCMEKFRQGYDPKEFAHPPPPKKKIRGHGPKIQNGKVNRSKMRRSLP